MVVEWIGTPHIWEECITPEQYKTFFAIRDDGILFNEANRILACTFSKNMDEDVSINELEHSCVYEIRDKIRNGSTSGILRRTGQKLCWIWEPKITVDGAEAWWGSFPLSAYLEMVKQLMLGETGGTIIV